MAEYRVKDIRGRFCPARSSWGNSSKGAGVIMHYAGTDVPAWAWARPLKWIKLICDLHSQPGRFAPGWTINGSAYTEFIFGRVVYRVRNYAADLPHCGNLYYNRNALGLHIPIGLNQLPKDAGDGTLVTAMQRADDHLRAMGLGRSGLKGHREVGSSLCPGDVIQAAIGRYRDGADFSYGGGEEAQPAPGPTGVRLYRPRSGLFSDQFNADALAQEQKARSFAASVEPHGEYWAVFNGAFSEMDGAKTTVNALHRAGYREAFVEEVRKS